MPRLRRRGHVLAERNTPESWRAYYLAELRAGRLPLRLPRGAFFALMGLHLAEVQYERERAAAGGPGWWRKEQQERRDA